jgi:2,3-diketo-5-methylthio-1-phosphopentane phosphatase
LTGNRIKRTYKVFVDFDGTITRQDVGEQMFLKFGDADEARQIAERWIKNEITSIDTSHLLCRTVRNFNHDLFNDFLSAIEIDDSFFDFVNFCEDNNIEIFVLSDGLDYYIDKLLTRENLNHLTVYSNRLTFDNNGNLIPLFPYTDEECNLCANCKRNHIINHSADDDITFYIGDGYSDTCPAQHVDFIYAKKSLLKYCEANRISYFPFDNFDDVIRGMKKLMSKRRLKKRHQAELKRKEVYQQG